MFRKLVFVSPSTVLLAAVPLKVDEPNEAAATPKKSYGLVCKPSELPLYSPQQVQNK